MGNEQSTLQKEGYTIEKETENWVTATKDGDRFFIRTMKISPNATLISEMETLNAIIHPHVTSTKNSFKDEDHDVYYLVAEHCHGGSLAEKTKGTILDESQILSWIVEICMALRTIHENGLFHKNLTPQNIFFTELGTLRLGGFGKLEGNNVSSGGEAINYLAPEVFTSATYDTKSDIWSVGCILYELFTQKLAFSAETTVDLNPRIISGPVPRLQDKWSSEFQELFSDILQRDPNSRPTTYEILGRPIVLQCLLKKSKTTAEHLQTQLGKLRAVADSLENVHQGATIGSLAGGVIGAAGGITSIVGLVLAPFTLGTSLIVTGVGIGVGVAGGVTAGASNITNMVNQASDRKAVQSIIKEFDEKMNAVALWLQEISKSLETINRGCSGDVPTDEDSSLNQENFAKVGTRIGRGLGGVSELFRVLRVVNIGKIAAQASRTVRLAEVATGALSALFVAADIFFIAMDAKEIHHIRQTTADGQTCSEIMKFVHSVRQTADELQGSLDEIKGLIHIIPFLEDERELEWECM
ncbi:serine/threonine-protein kinase Nek5-like isoform X2 [Morone saxatilis]|uniref:serine/threonine-protein kinase Nek5-like isoform X2 n=1 Tax=Morone saxatilis TaxID=34816 RepID=UPI0015E1C2FD|nr:serine/threonine-protein kinase Nek5-like isoform X2 [Morone saxatilis]